MLSQFIVNAWCVGYGLVYFNIISTLRLTQPIIRLKLWWLMLFVVFFTVLIQTSSHSNGYKSLRQLWQNSTPNNNNCLCQNLMHYHQPSPDIPKNMFHLHDSSRQVRIMMGVEGHWDNLLYLGPSCNFRYPREESVVVPPDSSHMDWTTIPGDTGAWLCLEARLPPRENVNRFKGTNICFQIYLNSKLLWIKWRCAVGKGEIQKTRN